MGRSGASNRIFLLFPGICAGWEAAQGIGNRKLRVFPKTPRLPRSVWQNLLFFQAIPRKIAHRIVIPSMNPSRGPRPQACVAAASAAPLVFVRSRHDTCLALNRVKKNSLPVHGSVNFSPSAAKAAAWRHGRPAGTNDSLGLLPPALLLPGNQFDPWPLWPVRCPCGTPSAVRLSTRRLQARLRSCASTEASLHRPRIACRPDAAIPRRRTDFCTCKQDLAGDAPAWPDDDTCSLLPMRASRTVRRPGEAHTTPTHARVRDRA